jgi:hypothetical protein
MNAEARWSLPVVTKAIAIAIDKTESRKALAMSFVSLVSIVSLLIVGVVRPMIAEW